MILLNEKLLKRYVVFLLSELGYSKRMAEALYSASGNRHLFWSNWIQSNCSKCVHNPDSCLFLNPKVTGNLQEEEMLEYNLTSVEKGGLSQCPLLSMNTQSNPNPNSEDTI